ncbi:MAG: ribulose-phosphate 3-epimerase [Lachnospiraceae bacterium]
MMNILSPSILSADFTRLGEEIRAVEKAGAKYLHIDVMDGRFVPSISFGMPVISSIRKASRIVFDVHLMIEEPIRYIDEFVKAGADIITIHLEACSDVKATLDRIHQSGVKAGITIKPATPAENLIPYLEQVEMILLMSVEPGFGGQKYIEGSTDKIRRVREMLKERGLNIDLEVDGGINPDNVETVLEAGANVIVAGSAVFGAETAKKAALFMEKLG